MAWWRSVLGLAMGGAGKPEVVLPEYVFIEGAASPWDVMYDTVHAAPGTPVVISTSEDANLNSITAARNLIRLSDGTLYHVYSKDLATYDQVYVKKSSDNGETWTDETRISTYAGMENDDQILSSMAVDSNNHLHAVWRGKATGFTANYQIWYALYDGSWNTPVRISTLANMNTRTQDKPCIAVDGNDDLHVVWRSFLGVKYGIHYRKYSGSWGTIKLVTDGAGMDTRNQDRPGIAVDGNNHLHIIWHGSTATLTRPRVWYRPWDGSWGTPEMISTAPGMDLNVQYPGSIAVDSNNHLHVVGTGKATGFTVEQIWHYLYDGSWQTPVRISTAPSMEDHKQEFPSIAVDPEDNLHVLWNGFTATYPTVLKVLYANYTDSWSVPEILQTSGKTFSPILRWSRWP